MLNEVRVSTMDAKLDEVRWVCADLQAYECPRCGLRLTATFSVKRVELEPYLLCGPCYEQRHRKVLMTPVIGPSEKNG